MRMKHLVYASIIASIIASVPFFVGSPSAASASAESAEPTLWGIYGAHNRHDCPVNNRETAIEVIALDAMDLRPLMAKYGITAILDQYHSGLEHTFLWAVETKEPHNLEEFSIERHPPLKCEGTVVPAQWNPHVYSDPNVRRRPRAL